MYLVSSVLHSVAPPWQQQQQWGLEQQHGRHRQWQRFRHGQWHRGHWRYGSTRIGGTNRAGLLPRRGRRPHGLCVSVRDGQVLFPRQQLLRRGSRLPNLLSLWGVVAFLQPIKAIALREQTLLYIFIHYKSSRLPLKNVKDSNSLDKTRNSCLDSLDYIRHAFVQCVSSPHLNDNGVGFVQTQQRCCCQTIGKSVVYFIRCRCVGWIGVSVVACGMDDNKERPSKTHTHTVQ